MKVIFLDIDGVLNDHTVQYQCGKNKFCGIYPAKVKLLNTILRKTGAGVVLSSAWRYMILNGAMTPTGFQYLLNIHGFDGQLVGNTCADEEIKDRSDQIKEWVKLNKPARWLAIDDLPLKLVPNFIQTVSSVGLEEKHIKQAIDILK